MNPISSPQDLGDGLILRRATKADAGALAQFNTTLFDPSVGLSVEIMVSGRHHRVRPEDFILVEDVTSNHKIAASGALFSHTWRYVDIPFEAGYLECIGTDPAYRQRGLMRKVIETAHEISATKGQPVQLVGGIRWFYRRFGYDYALAGPGHRELPLVFVPQLSDDETERYHIRQAQPDDIPTLMQLYERQCAGKLVTQVRTESRWHYDVSAEDQGGFSQAYYVICDLRGEIAGYFATWAGFPWGRRYLRELNVQENVPLQMVLPAVQRFLAAFIEDHADGFGPVLPTTIQFDLGFDSRLPHPVYEALDAGLTPYRGWSWYVRVPDVPKFLLHIAPILHQRLATSAMSGYDGDLKVSFYKGGVRLVFEQGQLVGVENWTSPMIDEGHDAAFPSRTFLQLLFGYRSLAELRYAFPDCWVNRKAVLLLNALFPTQPSWARP